MRSKNFGSPRRKREPQRLDQLIPQLMATRGYNRILSHDLYQEAWQQAAGQWAAHGRPGQLKRGVLEIVVSSSSVVQELTFHKKQILRQLIDSLPDQQIRDLRFVVGSLR